MSLLSSVVLCLLVGGFLSLQRQIGLTTDGRFKEGGRAAFLSAESFSDTFSSSNLNYVNKEFVNAQER